MRRSQKNDSQLSRFAYYKYSGIIVFVPIIFLAVGLYIYMSAEQEFFAAWSCETIENYLLSIDVPNEMISHDALTEQQHLKIHKINQECVDDTLFSNNEHK